MARPRLVNVELILYSKPLCPYCALLKDLVLKDILSDPLIAERIPFTEISVGSPITHWNPYKEISEEGEPYVIDLRTGRRVKIENRRDVRDYAHLFVSTPMLELRVYTDRRMDRYIFTGFLPLGIGIEEFRRRVIYFKSNLRGLLRIFAKRL